MKRLLLFAMGAMVSMTSFAQEEVDVTHYIQNAGFDEDLTFQADGKMKDAITTNHSLSERSWAYIAADSTVYAKPKESSSQQRKDGRSKLDAVNGFAGRVNGWTLTTGSAFPACEWTYFGTVPYALGADAVPIADDGDTYLLVPEKPEAANGEDNIGFAYLRAGWGGKATYKQTVKLPCAVYRLEYWSININPSASKGKNLSKVTCRKDTWPDETGFNSTEWTKHEIEFTPTAEFTMEFGFESEGGSGSNPFLCIDGIKLYKIGEADRDEINMSDIFDMADECQSLAGEATALGATALAEYIGDYGMELEDTDLEGDELEAAVKTADARMAEIREAIAQVEKVVAMLEKMDNLMKEKDFPGKDAFQTAYEKILGYIEGTPVEGEDIVAEILGAVEEANDAIKAYYMSQMDTASETNPADFTVFVNHNWFIKDEYAPVFEDGSWVFPHADEGGYTDGSSNDDFSSEGWTVTGTYTGGDQRLNYKFGYPCWNAWGSGINGTIAVGQTIEGLPNGYYTVSAMLVTQSGYLTDQHVYAESSSEKKISAPLTSEGWDEGNWETVAMTAEQKVLVVDGKLTIGAEGTGTGEGSAGWFCATNFQLNFLGLASDDVINEAVKKALNDKVVEANDFVATMHFKADQKALNDTVAKYKDAEGKDAIIAATGIINAALTEAKASEAKYLEYLPAETPEDITGKTLLWVKEILDGNEVEGKIKLGASKPIVQFAYDYVQGWMVSDTATYKEFDATVDLLKNYVNTYAPVFEEADALSQKAGSEAKTILENLMNRQKGELTAEMKDASEVNKYVAALKEIIYEINKQVMWEEDQNATDFTAFIQNPNAEAIDGWTFVMGNGDGNGEKSGQWYDGSNTRYFDSYNGGGLKDFMASQLITGLPNGTYKVGAYVRTPAEGAYIFAGTATDTTFVEIPLNYHATVTESTGEDTTVVASDKWGPIWEDAKVIMEDNDKYNALSPEEQERIDAIYNANNGEGRGWKTLEIPSVEVKEHELFIGMMTGTEASKTEKVFTGGWFSTGGWTLTLVQAGDNAGWNGPITGIQNIESNMKVDGIYTLTGVKADKLQRGINIVVRNGKVQKVLVK
jgi:HPt (histidine-containing phosphotransfer) domain-containing protein